jgi:hypothetical protein
MAGIGVSHAAERAPNLLKDAAAFRQQHSAGIRKRNAAPAADKQRHPETILEFPNLPAQGRLRDVKRQRGMSEVQMLRHGHEVTKVPEIDPMVSQALFPETWRDLQDFGRVKMHGGFRASAGPNISAYSAGVYRTDRRPETN